MIFNQQHTESVNLIESINSNQFLSAGEDNKIIIWNINPLEYVCTLQDTSSYGHFGGISSVEIAFGNHLISADKSGNIIAWLTSSKMISWKISNAHTNSINSLKLSRPTHLASGGDDGYLKVWNWLTSAQLNSIYLGSKLKSFGILGYFQMLLVGLDESKVFINLFYIFFISLL